MLDENNDFKPGMNYKTKPGGVLLFITSFFNSQETKIRRFVNADFGYEEQGKSAFGIGQFDNFSTSNINDKLFGNVLRTK